MSRYASLPSRFVLGLSLAVNATYATSVRADQIIKLDFLMKNCTSKSPRECNGYIAGIADALRLDPQPTICISGGTRLKSMREQAVRYIQSHRPDRGTWTAAAVRDALKVAFPCKKE